MGSITTTPHKPRVTRAWVQSKHGVSEVIVTKPNGETFTIPATKPKPRKPRARKGKPHKPQAKRSSRKVKPLTYQVSEQDTLAISLQERMDKLMREMGSIHLDDN
jgi:hypothetical protein